MAAQDLDAIERIIQSDPEIQRAIRQVQDSQAGQQFMRSGRPNAAVMAPIQNVRRVIEARLAANGLALPNDFFYSVREGQLNREGYFERNANWIVPMMFAGATGVGLATAGGAATELGPGSAGLFTAPTATSVPITQGAAAGAAASGTAAAASAPWWRELVPDSPQDYLRLGAGLLPLLGRAFSGGGGDGGQGPGASPELSELLGISMNRVKAQEPLFQNINRQMQAGLPSESLLPAPGGRGINTEADTAMDPQQLTALLRTLGGQ